MNGRHAAVAIACLAVLAACGGGSKPLVKAAPTIATLKARRVDVRTDEPVPGGSEGARENYQAFLKLDGGDAGLRAEAMRRLGDLKLEAGEFDRIQKDLAQGSPLDTTDAIQLYGQLLVVYPSYERNDGVLYQLARAYEADQQQDKALATLDQLVRQFPHSRYRDEAEFRRGEMLFMARRWPEAEQAYGAVLDSGAGSDFYEQSLYKHGWSRFKRGDAEGALDSFATLLDRKLLDAGGGERDIAAFTRPQRELVEDTLRVCGITFSFEDDAKGVDAFLRRHGPRPYAHLLYSTLGDLYVSKERWTDAADAYRAFVKREPDNELSPLLEMQAIEAYKRGGFASLVLDGKREYVERYHLGSSFWAQRQPSDAPLVVQELKTNVKDLAAYYHAQAQTTKAQTDYEAAARWYRAFLESFPDDHDVVATRYLLADTLFESHQYRDAALEYEHVAYDYPEHDKSATAGYAALVAYDKHEATLQGEARRAWHEAALDSGIRFAVTYQEHPEGAAVLVRTARELYDAGDFAKAIDVADIALSRRPAIDADKQRMSWTVIANSHFDLAQYDKAEEAYLKLQQLLPPKDPQRAAIDERLAAAVYKQAESRKANGDEAGAVDEFLRVGRLTPGSKIRATADYDAAALLIARQDWPKAIEVLEAFRKDFPGSELQPEVTRKLAVAYVEAGRTAPAAAEFERIGNAPGGTPDVQREALAQAAALYEKSGDTARTVATWEAYLKRFPQPFDTALEARQKLADIAGKQGNGTRRSTLLAEIVRSEAAAGSARTDRSRTLAASATLELARPARDAFNAIRLTLPLKKSLVAKRNAMQTALKAYEAADQYAIADVSTAATFEMAELYRRLGEDLMKSDRPKSLSGDELEQYNLLLEEQAYPFEEKAIEIHAVNATRTGQGIYDASVKASFAVLAKLKPARYAKVEEGGDLVIDIAAGAQPAAAAGKRAPKHAAPPVPLALAVRFQEAVANADHGKAALAEAEFAALEAEAPTLAGPALNRAILLGRAGRWAEAEAELGVALQRHPRSAEAAAELGLARRQLGEFAAAEQAYQQALELNAAAVRSHRNLGVLLDLYLQRPADALAQYEDSLALLGGEDKQLTAWIAELKQRVGGGQKNARTETP